MPSEIKFTKNIFSGSGIIAGDFQGVLKTAIKISNQAKSLAPKDTRRLANSIMYYGTRADGYKEDGGFNNGSGEKAQQQDALDTSTLGGGFLRATAWVGTNVFYAPYQEYGTRNSQGKAFLRPAVQIVLNPGAGLEIANEWVKAMSQAYAKRKIKRAQGQQLSPSDFVLGNEI